MSTPDNQLFREEALRHRAGPSEGGDVLRLSPQWTRWTYWVLVGVFLVGVVYSVVGTMHEYATGPAVVWMSGRTHITAVVAGNVATIEVRPGQSVREGEVLVTFSSDVEAAELGRIDREFELQLARSLADPADQSAKEALTELRTARSVAVARLEQRVVRAPQDGVVEDIRIRPGQLMSAGDTVLTLLGHDRTFSILAMLPAQYRPQLETGLSMRFEVRGYRYAYQETTITSVGAQIIGPREVQRYLGQQIQDTVRIEGPVVLVEATPSSTTFTVDDQVFDFYHGMNGTAEVRVRTERILLSLVPGLRVILGRSNG